VSSEPTMSDPMSDPGSTFLNTHQNGNKTMMNNLMNEDLARAQMSARLGEAHELRRGRQLAMGRRLSRRAERAAAQARLALARSL
jgi:hypothetical protein